MKAKEEALAASQAATAAGLIKQAEDSEGFGAKRGSA
jgi:hypothetical protein